MRAGGCGGEWGKGADTYLLIEEPVSILPVTVSYLQRVVEG